MKPRITPLQNLAIAYVSLWATSPLLAYGTTFRVLAVISVLLWAALELIRKGGVFAKPTLPVMLSGFYLIYTLFVEYVTDRQFTGLVQSYILLFFVLVYESRKSRLSTLKPVFWVIVLTLPIWLYKTYLAFDSIDPHIARLIVKSSDVAEELTRQGLGGYGLVYSMVLLMPVLVTMVVRNHQFDLRIPRLSPKIVRPVLIGVLAVNALLGMIVIFRAGYTIATVLMFFSTIIALSVRGRSTGHLVIVGSTGLIVLAVVLPILPVLLQQIVSLFEGTAYAQKVSDVILSLDYEVAYGTVEDRSVKYAASMRAFFDNPVVGSLSSDSVGGHSAILDRFGRYGVLIGGLFCYIYFHSLVDLMKAIPRSFSVLIAVLFASAVLALLNTVSGVFGVVLFVLIPTSCSMLNDIRSGRRARAIAVR